VDSAPEARHASSDPVLGALLKWVAPVAASAAITCTPGNSPERAGEPPVTVQPRRDAGVRPERPAGQPPPSRTPVRESEEAEPPSVPYLDPSQDPGQGVGEPPGPRCLPKVASCLPIPYNGDPQLRVGDVQTPYNPKARRHLVEEFAWRDDEHRCRHDGECVQTGCGNGCAPWRSESGPGICVHYKKLTEAYCGCVAGFCNWFTQRRKVWRFTPAPPVVRGWPKGAPRLTRAAYVEAVDLPSQVLTMCFAERHRVAPARFQVASTLDGAGKTTSTTITGLPDDARDCVRRWIENAEFQVPAGATPEPIVVSSTWSFGWVWVD